MVSPKVSPVRFTTPPRNTNEIKEPENQKKLHYEAKQNGIKERRSTRPIFHSFFPDLD